MGLVTLAAAPLLLTGLGTTALGVAVLIREEASRISQRFFLMTLMATLWLGCAAFLMAAPGPEAALRWSRASYVGVALLPVGIFHFTVVFLRQEQRLRFWIPLVWTLGLGFAVAYQASDLFLAGVARHPWGWYTHLEAAALLFTVFFALLLGASLGLLRQTLRVARQAIEREQIRALFVAFGVGSLGLFDFLPSFGLPVYPLGFLGVTGFLILAARALRGHHLVEVGRGFAAADVLATMPEAVVVTDAGGEIRLVNPAAARLLGCREQDLLGRGVSRILASPLTAGDGVSDTLVRTGSVRGRTMVWRTADGGEVEVEVAATLIRDDLGVPAGTVYVAEDARDRIRADRIEFQAFHDALTGLPNRMLFEERLADGLARARQRDDAALLALLYVDLDRFKSINDSLGHSVGDGLLQEVATRLRETLRQEDVVCRLGGDEFAALVEVRDADAAGIVARKVVSAMRRPFRVAGHEVLSPASVGVALHPRHGEDAESLLGSADGAMYEAKRSGGDGWKASGEGTARRAFRRLTLVNDLRRAIAGDELELHYQPIVDLGSGRVAAAEALVRWRKDGELRLPTAFLDTAEDAGLAGELGRWVLKEACRRAASWQTAQESRAVAVAVNLSAAQLQDAGLPRLVEAALAGAGLAPRLLQLEIGEVAVMKAPPHIADLLGELSRLGVRIALDDYGTGHSSLGHLLRLPLDVLKLDGILMRGVETRGREAAMVEAALAMARALDLEVVAEGVETDAQLRFLRDRGCPRAQGFAIAEPLPEERFRCFLEQADPLPWGLRHTWFRGLSLVGGLLRGSAGP